MRRARVTIASSSALLIAHPTTRREYKSSTTARYNQPSDVEIIVQSVTHFVFGAEEVKSRLSRFGANLACGSLFVVWGSRVFFGNAEIPRFCMSRTTRLCPQWIPLVFNTA